MKYLAILMVVLFQWSCTEKVGNPYQNNSQPDAVTQEGDAQNISADGSSLKNQALAILESKCASCHNLDKADGGFGTVLDIEEMIKSGLYIVPGDSKNSAIIARLAPEGNMPPQGNISEEERSILIEWVDQIETQAIVQLNSSTQLDLIRKDLEGNFQPNQRILVRYFSLQHAHNAGMSAAIRKQMVLALNKIINSFSGSPQLSLPVAIDPQELIYRVNLQDLGINPETFENVISNFYPFHSNFNEVAGDSEAQKQADDHSFLVNEVGTQNYVLRMDWFNATAPMPVLYQELMGLPPTQGELEQSLGINRTSNFNNDLVVRSGFRNSGVSSHNRVIERHSSSSTNLAFWLSYDFAANDGEQQNIFNFPLGPSEVGFAEKSFNHDGGEVIFQLPNGLFGYYLSLADGSMIDKGPLNIVRQPDGPVQFLQAILNGVSCMSCHNQGILYKKDEIRGFAALSQDFSAAEQDKLFNLYSTDETLKATIDQDNLKYFEALEALGIPKGSDDPVNIAFQHYNKNLYRADVQAELGLNDSTFNTLLTTEPFKSSWVSILVNSGSISRSEFNALYSDAINTFVNDISNTEAQLGDHVATPNCMVADGAFMAGCTFGQTPPPIEEPVQEAGQQEAANNQNRRRN